MFTASVYFGEIVSVCYGASNKSTDFGIFCVQTQFGLKKKGVFKYEIIPRTVWELCILYTVLVFAKLYNDYYLNDISLLEANYTWNTTTTCI